SGSPTKRTKKSCLRIESLKNPLKLEHLLLALRSLTICHFKPGCNCRETNPLVEIPSTWICTYCLSSLSAIRHDRCVVYSHNPPAVVKHRASRRSGFRI